MSYPPNDGGFGRNFPTPPPPGYASTPQVFLHPRPPRFAYSGPPNYPRPGSSATKPNPCGSFSELMRSRYNPPGPMTDSMANNCGESVEYMDSSYTRVNESFVSEYSSNDSLNSSTYFSCNESFSNSPMKSCMPSPSVPAEPQTHIRKVHYKASSSVFSGKKNAKPYARPNQSHKKSEWRCDLCNVDFTSKIPFAMHFQGAKHAKKLKTNEALKSIQSEVNGTTPLHISSFYRCEVCGVIANGTFQLQTHLNGVKHKTNIALKEKMDKEAKEKGKTKDKSKPEGAESTETGPSQNKEIKKKKFVSVLNADADVTKMNPAITVKKPTYLCVICAIILNSEAQYQQHLAGKFHKAKVSGKPIPSKRNLNKTAAPSSTVTSETASVTAESGANKTQSKVVGVKTLTASFVPGGKMEQ